MRDLIINLYQNENFPIYLGSIIFVLLVAFFVVFFLGRKKIKEEKTVNTFKETSVSTPVEVSKSEDAPIEIPYVESEIKSENIGLQPQNDNITDDYSTPFIEVPVKVNIDNFDNLASSIESELNELEKHQQQAKEFIEDNTLSNDLTIAMPNELTKQDNFEQPKQDNFEQPKQDSFEQPKQDSFEQPKQDSFEQPKQDSFEQPKQDSFEQPKQDSFEQPIPVSDEPKTDTRSIEVYSSVYTPKQSNDLFDETMEIELPRLKSEVKENIPSEGPILKEESDQELKI